MIRPETGLLFLPRGRGILLRRDGGGVTRAWAFEVRAPPSASLSCAPSVRSGSTESVPARIVGPEAGTALWEAVRAQNADGALRILDLVPSCWRCGLLKQVSPCWLLCGFGDTPMSRL